MKSSHKFIEKNLKDIERVSSSSSTLGQRMFVTLAIVSSSLVVIAFILSLVK